MSSEWFEEFLVNNIRVILTEKVTVPRGLHGIGSREVEYVLMDEISWKKMFDIVDANNLPNADRCKTDFAYATAKGRGRVAMNIYNTLRGVARRRGGLWAVTPEGEKVWVKAPQEWLNFVIEINNTDPVEDPFGNPITNQSA
jgi:hypothetical protein